MLGLSRRRDPPWFLAFPPSFAARATELKMVESSSDDEDVPVSGLGKSHAEAVPEAVPDAATPSTKDSDDDDSDDVVGGVRGRLA